MTRILAAVHSLLDAELESFEPVLENRRKRDLWMTARKWLSGLAGVEDLAFWDLDPLRINDSGSVLNAIADSPLTETQHGAIIGTDNRLIELVDELVHGAPWWVKLIMPWISKAIAKRVALADRIYKTDAMRFPGGVRADLAADYENGILRGKHKTSAAIPDHAHDFVIPSVSQLLVPADGLDSHLGNVVNTAASHISGAVDWSDDGARTDEELVHAMLRRIKPVARSAPAKVQEVASAA